MKVIIPQDIKDLIRRRKTIRIAVFLFLVCISVILFVFFKPLSQLEPLNRALTFAACIIISAAVTGFPFRVFGKDWQGEVVEVKIKTRTENSSPILPTRAFMYTANVAVVTIKTPDGGTIRKDADKLRAKYSQPRIEDYDVHDYVVHLFGTKYVAHYKPGSGQSRCVICGLSSSADVGKCPGCGHGLITFVGDEGNSAEKE